MEALPLRYDAADIAKRWYATDPAAALAWAQSRPDQRGQRAYVQILHLIAQQDPARAAALLADAPTSLIFLQAASRVAEAMAQRDPASARAWVEAHYHGDARIYALHGIIRALTDTDPMAALTLLNEVGWHHYLSADKESLDSTTNRAEDPIFSIDGLLTKLAQSNPQAAMEAVAKASEPTLTQAGIMTVLSTWFAQDRTAALKWLGANLGKSNFGTLGMGTVAECLTLYTPMAEYAALWKEIAPELDSQSTVAQQLAQGMTSRLAASDPAAAEAFIASLPSALQDRARSEYWKGMLSTRPFEAISQVLALGDSAENVPTLKPGKDPFSTASNEQLGRTLADAHAPAAAALLQAHRDSIHALELVPSFVDHWLINEPAAASSWAAELPQGPMRSSAAERIVSYLLDEEIPDVEAVVAWMDNIEDADSYDHARSSLSHKVDLNDFPDAIARMRPALSQEILPE